MLDAATNAIERTQLKQLLLLTGSTFTPAGVMVKRKTLLECAIEAGDPDMVALLQTYFAKIGFKDEMEKQVAPYRTINLMSDPKPNNFLWLLEIIKKSSLTDVQAELATGKNYNAAYESDLRDAMRKFRNIILDPGNRTITKPRMHCNYQNLISAYDLLNIGSEYLKQANNIDKYLLVARQIIGFIQLAELPAVDRFIFARGQLQAVIEGQQIERSFTYKIKEGSFPQFGTAHIDARSGLGFDFYVGTQGLAYKGDNLLKILLSCGFHAQLKFPLLVKQKADQLSALIGLTQKQQKTTCVMM